MRRATALLLAALVGLGCAESFSLTARDASVAAADRTDAARPDLPDTRSVDPVDGPSPADVTIDAPSPTDLAGNDTGSAVDGTLADVSADGGGDALTDVGADVALDTGMDVPRDAGADIPVDAARCNVGLGCHAFWCGCGRCDPSSITCVAVARDCPLDCHNTCPELDTTVCACAGGGCAAPVRPDAGRLGEGAPCDSNDGCANGLLCCYPCGVPGCFNQCTRPEPGTPRCPRPP